MPSKQLTVRLRSHPAYMAAHCGWWIGSLQQKSTRTRAHVSMLNASHHPESTPLILHCSGSSSVSVDGLLLPLMVTILGGSLIPGTVITWT
jgi:hypothetical protein